jgi:hypothetical protein
LQCIISNYAGFDINRRLITFPQSALDGEESYVLNYPLIIANLLPNGKKIAIIFLINLKARRMSGKGEDSLPFNQR